MPPKRRKSLAQPTSPPKKTKIGAAKASAAPAPATRAQDTDAQGTFVGKNKNNNTLSGAGTSSSSRTSAAPVPLVSAPQPDNADRTTRPQHHRPTTCATARAAKAAAENTRSSDNPSEAPAQRLHEPGDESSPQPPDDDHGSPITELDKSGPSQNPKMDTGKRTEGARNQNDIDTGAEIAISIGSSQATGKSPSTKEAVEDQAQSNVEQEDEGEEGDKHVTITRKSSRPKRLSSKAASYTHERDSDDPISPTDNNVRPNSTNIYEYYLGLGSTKNDCLLNLDESSSTHNINNYLQVFYVEGKGRGIRTLRTIPAGFLLLQEPALVRGLPPKPHSGHLTRSKKYMSQVRPKIHALSSEHRRKFLTLCFKDTQDTEESRIHSNAFGFPIGENESRNHVWYYISMLNHSCTPNAFVMPYGAGKGYNLRTSVIIPANTEVTINYNPARETNIGNAQRQFITTIAHKADIKKSWDFVCQCPPCQDPTSTDAAFKEMGELRNQLKIMQGLPLSGESPSKTDDYNITATKYISLLQKYNLVRSIYTAVKHAVDYNKNASTVDDVSIAWRAKWQREALASAIVEYGIEDIGDKPELGDGFVRIHGKELVWKTAGKVQQSMWASFNTSVMPDTANPEHQDNGEEHGHDHGEHDDGNDGDDDDDSADDGPGNIGRRTRGNGSKEDEVQGESSKSTGKGKGKGKEKATTNKARKTTKTNMA